jgi:hypothetical protein
MLEEFAAFKYVFEFLWLYVSMCLLHFYMLLRIQILSVRNLILVQETSSDDGLQLVPQCGSVRCTKYERWPSCRLRCRGETAGSCTMVSFQCIN